MTILDCNNFWSPSGGGVRRYHLEKLDFFMNQTDVRYVFVMHDNKTYTEQIGKLTFIEHIQVPKAWGNWEYRYLLRRSPLERIVLKHTPDIIEVGSPYILPSIVQSIVKRNKLKTKVFGFWHADFPVTYVGRFLKKLPFLQKVCIHIAWQFARHTYNQMHGILVASHFIMNRMKENGLFNLHYSPLGVNSQLFHPNKKDDQLIQELKADSPDRLILFFPHRFSKEKGLHILLKAYEILIETMEVEPALVFAGAGPYENWVKEYTKKYRHVHYLGFIHDKEVIAKYYASADIGFALSEWETFGLSLIEALSSGLPLIYAKNGAAQEHAINSGVGVILEQLNPSKLANAIREFPKLSSNWDNKAREYAEAYSWSKSFDNQILIYKKVLDKM